MTKKPVRKPRVKTKPLSEALGKKSDKENEKKSSHFQPGNELWKLASRHGPLVKFETGEDLWAACCEYFQWVVDNPLHEAKPFAYEGNVTIAQVAKLRAMTIRAMCLHIGVSYASWADWRHSRPDLVDVINRVDDIIYSQKFEGASAGLLAPMIIARDLGLTDKHDIQSSDGSMRPMTLGEFYAKSTDESKG